MLDIFGPAGPSMYPEQIFCYTASLLIKYSAAPRALLAPQPHASCFISRIALVAML